MTLKHLYDLSDEQVVERWVENPYWQYFCGEQFFSHHFPIHPTSMTKWRNRLGKDGVEKLLVETINTGLKSKTIKPNSLTKVTVDTTVQEKNVAFPTDSKLLNKARELWLKLPNNTTSNSDRITTANAKLMPLWRGATYMQNSLKE